MNLKNIKYNDVEHGQLIGASARATYHPVYDPCISRVDGEGKLVGGAIYERYTGRGGSIFVSVAGFRKGWLNRDLLWAAFDYPFRQLDCRKMFSMIRATNEKSLHFNLNLGFKAESIVQHVFPGDDGDMVLTSMYRAECKFLGMVPPSFRGDHGQGQRYSSAA